MPPLCPGIPALQHGHTWAWSSCTALRWGWETCPGDAPVPRVGMLQSSVWGYPSPQWGDTLTPSAEIT